MTPGNASPRAWTIERVTDKDPRNPHDQVSHTYSPFIRIVADDEEVCRFSLHNIEAYGMDADSNDRNEGLASLIVDAVNERERLKSENFQFEVALEEVAGDRDRLLARMKVLEEALDDYGDHFSTCNHRRSKDEPCNCRWEETRLALLPAPETKGEAK